MTDDADAAKTAEPAPAAEWGYPRFAREFPKHAALDALVAAFSRGDYAAVRRGADALSADASAPDDVRAAARTLVDRTRPDPAAKALFLFAAGLLVFLTVWWIVHDGPPPGRTSAPATTATVEIVR